MILLEAIGLLTLGVGALAQSPREEINNFLKDPNFVPYKVPAQRVEEWIALGDSYTAGTGSNGEGEKAGVDAVRGLRSWAHQMSEDSVKWKQINGEGAIPRFTWSAYTGDRAKELRDQQLKVGNYEDRSWADRGRNIWFGKPQLAAMTIGGNDALLSTLLNDCIYRAWLPGDCQKTITSVKNLVTGDAFADTIAEAMFKVVRFGRDHGGAEPPQSFQLYVLPYIDFFNAAEGNFGCDKVDWRYWSLGDACPLTLDLRKQLNDLSKDVNVVIKKEAENLASLGVIFVGDPNPEYNGHRFCEPERTTQEMADKETWFWSRYSKTDTEDEGTASSVDDQAQKLLDFVLPDKGLKANELQRLPYEEPEAVQRFPDFNSLLRVSEDAGATDTPFNLLRSFHPKGTAYTVHKNMFMKAVGANREAPMFVKCKDAQIVPLDLPFPEDRYRHHVAATCSTADGAEVRSQQDLNLCLGWDYDSRKIVIRDDGIIGGDCTDCKLDNNALVCACRDPDDPTGIQLDGSINFDDFMTVKGDGHMKCLGHISAKIE